jgi:predicted DCC family thiol-disulfide oxidoreductase YuxK
MDDLVVFDGVCNLCTASVTFILRHEAEARLRFGSLQSPAGSRLMRELGLDPEDARTFVLLAGGKAFLRSEAALRVCGYFRWPWRALAALRVVPRPIRDRAYDLVARHRYRWFGRTEACLLPTPELRARFIEA